MLEKLKLDSEQLKEFDEMDYTCPLSGDTIQVILYSLFFCTHIAL